jgi:DNA-directed RNA polymerase subunit F
VEEQSRIETFMQWMQDAAADYLTELQRVHPEAARRLQEAIAQEKKVMDRYAKFQFGRDECFFCTAEAQGTK